MMGILNYPGGKARQVKKLIEFIPEHVTYTEVFAGSAALLFAKEPSRLEVYNDIHSGLVAIFSCLRDEGKFHKFQHLVLATPFSREEYYDCADTWQDCNDEIEKARKYFVMLRQCFISRNHSRPGWSYDITPVNTTLTKWLNTIDRLPDIHNRLRYLQIDCLDYKEIFKKYDSPTTFFYCDPPYYNITGMYQHDFKESDHEELLRQVTRLKGKVLLSNYRNDLYNILDEIGWKSVDYNATGYTAAGKLANSKRIETVWMNYELK